MRGKVKIKNKRISKIASKTILILIAILTILAFCAGEYEKMQAAPNLIRANANSTAESDTSQGNTSSDTNNGEKPITFDQNQLESLDEYISNNKQNPDSETPKEEQTTEDGIQPDEENQGINEQNEEENSDVNAISDDATANGDEGIALLSSESKGQATVSWKSQIKGEYWNKINKIIATSDGGAVAVGWIYQESTNPTITTNGNKDALIIKYNKDGKIEWFKNYGGSDDDEFTDIAQASDNSFRCVGTEFKGNDGQLIISVYDKDGEYAITPGMLIQPATSREINGSPKLINFDDNKFICYFDNGAIPVVRKAGTTFWKTGVTKAFTGITGTQESDIGKFGTTQTDSSIIITSSFTESIKINKTTRRNFNVVRHSHCKWNFSRWNYSWRRFFWTL